MKDKLVIIGKCGRPYGVRGWMHVQSFTAEPQNILLYKNWTLILPSGDNRPVQLDGLRAHGNHFVAKIKGTESPEAAKLLGLAQIAIAQSDLPSLEKGEHYWAELTGLKAILPNGSELGIVDSLFETGANDVIVVTTPGKQEILVPYIDSVVLEIDTKQGTITLDWDPAERLGQKL
jgi:16S rRNA processing protein RimM